MTSNLFRDINSVGEIEQIFRRHPRRPLLPPIGSDAWKSAARNPIAAELARPLRERAIAESAAPLPVLTDELYASFKATGRRVPFESVYFERRRRLGRAAIAVLLAEPGDPKAETLTASMVEKLADVFGEVSWALPAHVNWHDDNLSGKEPMQIDLFCAETANLMAEMLDLFGPILPAELQSRIRERLRTQVWENYVQRFDAMHWAKATHNWNAVCHQGVLGSALSQAEDAGLLARMFWLARGSLPLFLGGFTRDGGCTEGVGYWSYGFGWFTVLNEQIEARTGGELSIFEGDHHVRRIARFGPRMSLAGDKLVNFSDNGAEGTLNGPLAAYLGERLDDPEFAPESAKAYRRVIKEGIALDTERCDVLYLSRLFLRCPVHEPAARETPAADCFLPDLAVLVAHGADRRGHRWDLAAKAGHNQEHHNHNDCGNFILNIDGLRFIAEIGAPEYTKDFFGEKRYESLAARSLGHSLPVINGIEQAAGERFTSRVTGWTLSPELTEFKVDATGAYPPEAHCRSFVRELRLEKESGKLTVSDGLVLNRSESLEGAFVAIYPIQLEKGHAVIRAEGVELIIRALPGTRFDRVDVLPYPDRSGKEAFIHRLVVKPAALSPRVTLAVEMALA